MADDEDLTHCYNCGDVIEVHDAIKVYLYEDDPDIPEYLCSEECYTELKASLERAEST